jgi:hypothetical protein
MELLQSPRERASFTTGQREHEARGWLVVLENRDLEPEKEEESHAAAWPAEEGDGRR